METTGSEKISPFRQLGYPRDLHSKSTQEAFGYPPIAKSKNLFGVLLGPVVFPSCSVSGAGGLPDELCSGQASHDYSWFGFFDVMKDGYFLFN